MTNNEAGDIDSGRLPEGAVEELAELLDEQPNPDQEVRTKMLSRMMNLLEQHFTNEAELKLKGEAQKLQSELVELQASDVELTQDDLKALLNSLIFCYSTCTWCVLSHPVNTERLEAIRYKTYCVDN